MVEDDHHREVYAHFGLAIFHAQVLEHGIVNALVYLDLIPNRRAKAASLDQWASEFDRFMEGKFAKTMGALIKELRRQSSLPTDLERDLAASLDRRNYLVHDYFKERVLDFDDEDGRNRMIEDMSAASNLFTKTTHMIDATIDPLMRRWGLTPERLNAAMAQMKEEHRAKARR